MPRPDPKKVATNKAAKAEVKARMDAAAERVQKLITDTISEFRTRLPEEHPDPHMQLLFEKLWRAFELAMATSQPNHAIQAVMSEAKLRGFLVDQQLVISNSQRAGGVNLTLPPTEGMRLALARMRERAAEAGQSADCEKMIDYLKSTGSPTMQKLLTNAELDLDAEQIDDDDDDDDEARPS